MSKKESVRLAIERNFNEYIPSDIFEGWMWPGIQKKMMTGLNATDFNDLLNKLDINIRWFYAKYNGPSLPEGAYDRIASPHSVYSLNGSIWGLKPGLKEHGKDSSEHPMAKFEDTNEIENYEWPSPDWFDYTALNEKMKLFSDKFLIVGGFSPVFYLIADLFGMEKTLMNFILNQKITFAVTEKIQEFYENYYNNIYLNCNASLDAIAFGDDFSSQQNMLLSPEHWRKFFKPVWKKLFEKAKNRGYKVFFHSCGSVFGIIEDLIEIGLDVLYPLQPKAVNMDITLLRKKFGKNLSFYGGIDVQELLPFGTTTEIKKEVEKYKGNFSLNGGYVLSTSHVIMEDVPVDNVIALYVS